MAMDGKTRLEAARLNLATNRGYAAGMRDWQKGNRAKANAYGPDTPRQSYPTNNPRSPYGEYLRGREFAKLHLRQGFGPASAGQSLRSKAPLKFNDAPSQNARMFGGGRFGGNSTYTSRR